MQLEILSPERSVFNGNVYGVQLPGIDGSFEVLENHAPMIAALGKGRLKVIPSKNGGQEIFFQITGGFVEVLNNKVKVLVEHVETQN